MSSFMHLRKNASKNTFAPEEISLYSQYVRRNEIHTIDPFYANVLKWIVKVILGAVLVFFALYVLLAIIVAVGDGVEEYDKLRDSQVQSQNTIDMVKREGYDCKLYITKTLNCPAAQAEVDKSKMALFILETLKSFKNELDPCHRRKSVLEDFEFKMAICNMIIAAPTFIYNAVWYLLVLSVFVLCSGGYIYMRFIHKPEASISV